MLLLLLLMLLVALATVMINTLSSEVCADHHTLMPHPNQLPVRERMNPSNQLPDRLGYYCTMYCIVLLNITN